MCFNRDLVVVAAFFIETPKAGSPAAFERSDQDKIGFSRSQSATRSAFSFEGKTG